MPTASTLSVVLVVGSLSVALLAAHYLWRTGRRNDPLCTIGLVATIFGMQLAARAIEVPDNLYYAGAPGFALFLFAMVIWREGLRRFRATH